MTLDLESDRALLADVFPKEEKFRNTAFLSWQYTQSPSGVVVESNRDDELGRIGHYAVLPQRWSVHGERSLLALSLNTAVAERGRGHGLFTLLADSTYEAARTAGIAAIVGVANAQSTPGFLGKLGFTFLGSLEVTVLAPRPLRRRNQSLERVDLPDLSDAMLDRYSPDSGGVARIWDTAELTWRLSDPGRRFTVFADEEMLAITCTTRQLGVPFAVILKVLVQPGASGLGLANVVNAACRHHKAVFALHAGRNSALAMTGIRVPQRLKPSPLNLIARSLHPNRPTTDFVPTSFEFLEFDAY